MITAGARPTPFERRAILVIVDDEPAITTSLRGFFTLETDYEIHTFQSPTAALDAVERLRPDAVISDFLMPEMDGIAFLSRVRRLDPDIPLILLTGYADKENAIRAINDVGLYHYVEKPWDNDALKLIVQNGLRQYSLARALRAKIAELDGVLNHLTSVEARNELLSGEIEMARRIQESLLPAASPRVPGLHVEALYEPLIEVGGDFFDFHAGDSGRLDLIVADVVGHGVQAALITSMVKALFIECLEAGLLPAATLDRMNERLGGLLPVGRFVTAVVAQVDPASRRIAVANAGHPRPYLLSHRRGRIEAFERSGTPLAVIAGAEAPPYETEEMVAAPGDLLFLYTDGLTDLASPDGEPFGERGLAAALEEARTALGDAVGGRILSAGERFAGGGPREDDVNIVTVRFEE